jgi:hypothetical protein
MHAWSISIGSTSPGAALGLSVPSDPGDHP